MYTSGSAHAPRRLALLLPFINVFSPCDMLCLCALLLHLPTFLALSFLAWPHAQIQRVKVFRLDVCVLLCDTACVYHVHACVVACRAPLCLTMFAAYYSASRDDDCWSS